MTPNNGQTVVLCCCGPVCAVATVNNVNEGKQLYPYLIDQSLLKTHTNTMIQTLESKQKWYYSVCTQHTQKQLLIVSVWCHGTRLLWVKFELRNIVFKHRHTHTRSMPKHWLPFPLLCNSILLVWWFPRRPPLPLVIWCMSQATRQRSRSVRSASSADKLEPVEYETTP